MKQILTVNTGFAELLEFITPSLKLFPVWPGDINDMAQYEIYIRGTEVVPEIASRVGNLNAMQLMMFLQRLHFDLTRYCPQIMEALVSHRNLGDVSQEQYRAFPVDRFYRIWAAFCRWPKMLDAIGDDVSPYGLIHYPFPHTYAAGSGLVIRSEEISLLYPDVADSDYDLQTIITTLVSNILPHQHLPICFRSPHSLASHPWVALIGATLRLVGRRGRPEALEPAESREVIRGVMEAFVYDRTEFAWIPRETYEFSPGVSKELWLGQVARLMEHELSTACYDLDDDRPLLQQHISDGLSSFRSFAVHHGVKTEASEEWAALVTKYTMAHTFPETAGSINYGWVARMDAEVLDELNDDDNEDGDGDGDG